MDVQVPPWYPLHSLWMSQRDLAIHLVLAGLRQQLRMGWAAAGLGW